MTELNFEKNGKWYEASYVTSEEFSIVQLIREDNPGHNQLIIEAGISGMETVPINVYDGKTNPRLIVGINMAIGTKVTIKSETPVYRCICKEYSHRVPIVSGTNDGTNWTSITIDENTYAIPQGGGGLSNHDFTFLSLADNNTSFTFPANQRCYQYVSVSATSVMNFGINNGADNYVRIHNSGSSDAILAINAVTHNGTTVGNIIAPAEIKCAAGKYIEISVIYDGVNAVFTVSGDLQNLN